MLLEDVVGGPILTAAELAGWPQIALGTLTVEGETAWRAIVLRMVTSSPGRAGALLASLGAEWLSAPMIATPSAQSRLRRWFDSGRPTFTAEEIRRRLAFMGDPEVKAIVISALAERIPPPVTHHVLTCCWVFGAGWSSRGWTGAAPPPPDPSMPEPLRVILVAGSDRDAEETASVFAHEVGHGWTLEPVSAEAAEEHPADRNARAATLDQIAVAVGRLDEWVAGTVNVEHLAASCARCWGFKGSAADARVCAAEGIASRYRSAEAAGKLPFGSLL